MTSAAPVPAGAVAVIEVDESIVKTAGLAAVRRKSTPVAPVNPVPVMVTSVPPAAGPMAGLTPVTVGP